MKQSTILANKAPPKPTSWWEDGYDRKTSAENIKGDGGERFFSGFAADGQDFLIETVKTDLHQLHGLFLNHKPSSFLLLNEPGKGNFQKNSSVTTFSLSQNGIVKEDSFLVGDHSGYMTLSRDDALLAVGVLKEDTVQVYQMDSGELLVNVRGGQKVGYFGELYFLSDKLNTSLMELRVTELQKGRPTKCLLRLWDLGFRSRREPTESDSDSDADEEENKLWEKKITGEATCFPTEDNVLVTRSASNTLEWLDISRAKIQRTVKSGKKWTLKTVVSSDKSFVAVSHFGSCSIYDVKTGEKVEDIISPDDTSSMYPLTPVTFFGENDAWLLLRINQERTLVVCNWRNSSSDMISLSSVGGTISDNCVQVSPDGNYLVCWPFGYLELYHFGYAKNILFRKVSLQLKWECILLRQLLLQERAVAKYTGTAEKLIHRKFFQVAFGELNFDVFRHIVSFL